VVRWNKRSLERAVPELFNRKVTDASGSRSPQAGIKLPSEVTCGQSADEVHVPASEPVVGAEAVDVGRLRSSIPPPRAAGEDWRIVGTLVAVPFNRAKSAVRPIALA
jgi:hypothetical protein